MVSENLPEDRVAAKKARIAALRAIENQYYPPSEAFLAKFSAMCERERAAVERAIARLNAPLN